MYTENGATHSHQHFANVQLHCQQELKPAYHPLNNYYSLTFSFIHHFAAGVTSFSFFLPILTQSFGCFIMQTNSPLKYVLSLGSLICISDRSLLYCVSRNKRHSGSCYVCFIISSFSSLFSDTVSQKMWRYLNFRGLWTDVMAILITELWHKLHLRAKPLNTVLQRPVRHTDRFQCCSLLFSSLA